MYAYSAVPAKLDSNYYSSMDPKKYQTFFCVYLSTRQYKRGTRKIDRKFQTSKQIETMKLLPQQNKKLTFLVDEQGKGHFCYLSHRPYTQTHRHTATRTRFHYHEYWIMNVVLCEYHLRTITFLIRYNRRTRYTHENTSTIPNRYICDYIVSSNWH